MTAQHGIRPSIESIFSPWDNVAAEFPTGTVRSECVHVQTPVPREEAPLGVSEYVECFYNKVHIHSTAGWMSPDEFERRMTGDRSNAT